MTTKDIPSIDSNSSAAIRGAQCVLPSPTDPDKLVVQTTSVAFRSGKITAVGDRAHLGCDNVFDGTGLHLLPGIIDSQVHFREPGLNHKEDLESGTRGAVLGGVTAVFEMPNTKPATTTAEAFAEKLQLAKNRAWSDISFFIGACPENVEQLPALELHPNCCAIKIFMGSSTGSLLIEDDTNLRRILGSGRRRVAVHSEDEARLKERKALLTGKNDVALHPFWRDEITAVRSTERLLRIAKEFRRPIHVLHITTAEEIELLKAARDLATFEVTPQHLTLAAPDCYQALGTLAQMNPPIREARHREALWRALNDDLVYVIGSDHAPHTREEKSLPYPSSPSGMTGVQTILPIMLNHVHEQRLSLIRLVELLARNPARLYHAIGKGEISVGRDADFTVVDLHKNFEITDQWIASKVGWTPFNGMKITGLPVGTIIRGNWVMREGQLLGTPIGQPIRFQPQ